MEIVRVLSMAVESAGRARGIKPSDEIHLSALRWETYSALQNLLDALSMLASTLGLRKPSSYAELGIILREGGILDEGDAELVGRVARSRNLLAHAYRRMSGEELMEMVEALLPGVEDMAGRLMGEVERRGIDPEGEFEGLKSLRELFESEGILLAYLYGSRARGDADEDSDYDIALLYGRPIGVMEEVEMAVRIADRLKIPADRVDLLILNKAGVDLAMRVIREGKPIYVADEDFRHRYEAHITIEYLDLNDLMDIYLSRAMKKS